MTTAPHPRFFFSAGPHTEHLPTPVEMMLLGTIHHGHGTRRKQSKQRKKPTLSKEINSSCATPKRQNPSPLPHKKKATRSPLRPKSIIDPVPSRRLLVQNSNCCVLSTSNQFFFFSILRLPRRPHPPPGKTLLQFRFATTSTY